MNTITVKGNVGDKGPIRYTQRGKPVFSFSVADNFGKDEYKKTQWWKVIIYGEVAHEFEHRVQKGLACEATGRAELRTYEKRDGSTGWSLEIHSEVVKLGDEVQWGKGGNKRHWQDNEKEDDGGPSL